LKKETKTKLLGGLGLLIGAVVLSGCTANFCSDVDKANMAYPYEQGVSVYCNKDDLPNLGAYQSLAKPAITGNDNVYYYVPVNSDGYYAAKKANFLTNTIISTAEKNNYIVPSQAYFTKLDSKVLNEAISQAIADGAKINHNGTEITLTQANIKDLKAEDINPFIANKDNASNPTAIKLAQDCIGNESLVTTNDYSLLRRYGYLKFYGDDGVLWNNWKHWNTELASDPEVGVAGVPNSDFTTLYQTDLNNKLNASRTCITITDGNYGHYGDSSNWEVAIRGSTWTDAWHKGFLEGLIEYPVVWMVDTFAKSFDPQLTGFGQIWAIVLVTLIVRVVVLALTFKSTMDQQKTQALQPQLAKIQAKYPNSNTNKAEAARLSQEQMALYKRNKVNPFSVFLAMIVQFPVFIAVWGALQGSAVLSTGEVLNLRLSDTIQSVLTNVSGTWYYNTSGWWTAFILFLLMSVFQWLAMMLPQWMAKRRTKGQSKVSANPAADKQTSTMKWVSYGMLIFTIIMGFALPAAMGVYWAIGAVISMIQTVVTQWIMAKKQDKEKRL
jgi:YidC/Oxa1 family membrane protein insertase